MGISILNKSILFLFFLFFIFSCRSNKLKDEAYAKQIIDEWVGKQVVLPDKVYSAVLGRDTICDELLRKPVKVLVYVDSIGCAACKLNLYDWNQKIDSLSYNEKLGFLFFVNTDNYNAFSNRVKSEAFRHPIFYDKKNELNRVNNFPKDNHFQTFLLDNNNRVVLIGTPLGNQRMWSLYLREIDRLTTIE